MKSIKKLLAVVLSLAMVLGTLTVTALADEETPITNSNGLTTALSTGGNYILSNDIVFTNGLTDVSGVSTTINLNGHKIYRASGGAVMTVNGTLTIKDTSTNADGYIGFEKSTNSTSKVATIFEVKSGATFNLQSGGLKNMKSTHESAIVIKNGGTFNMTGGFITNIQSTNRRGLQNSSSASIMNLSGGEIYGNTNGDTGADVFVYNGTCNISSNMKINGSLNKAGSTGKINITGGWFSSMPDDSWINKDYAWKADTTTMAGYAGQVVAAVAQIGDKGYCDVDAALTAATDGQTVKLLADCSSDSKATIATSVTLDLNGKTLTCASQATDTDARLANVNAGGTLTIDDKSTGTPGKIIAPTKCASSAAIAYAYKGTLIIKNGRFQDGGAEQTESVFGKGKDGTLEVYGGYYTEKSVNGLNDYVKGDDDTKIYGIVEDSTYDGFPYTAGEVAPKVTVNGQGYASFDAAMAAIVESGEYAVKLLADCVKTTKVTEIAENTTITLDLNGYTLTNTFSGSTGENARSFKVSNDTSVLNVIDGSTAKTGAFYANAGTSNGTLAIASAGGTLNVSGGTFYKGTGGANLIARGTAEPAGKVNVTGGWWEAEVSSAQISDGYYSVKVADTDSKASTPYTVSNTAKTITYLKNTGNGTDIQAQTYAYIAGHTTLLNTRSLSYTKASHTCVGWSTNPDADPESTNLIGGGEAVDFSDNTLYPVDAQGNVNLYAIYKKVDSRDWVCVDTNDPTVGYADLASAFVGSSNVTLIKDYNGRTTIEVAGSRILNLNGYNIVANTPEDNTGSAIVVKITGGQDADSLSIYNNKIGVGDFPAGSEGKVEGYAQKTGGAIDVIGSVGAIVKIYGGTFTGDAKDHGTVLTCSGVGKAYIYGGTFIPADPASTVDSLYANNGKIFVMGGEVDGGAQSDVKIQGVMAKNSGTIGIIGGYFSDAQPNATFGTYDSVNDRIDTSSIGTKDLRANTGDATYPYSVGAMPWYITYNYGAGKAPASANPTEIEKGDETVIELNAPTPAEGYNFTGYKDQDGNDVTSLVGTIEKDLTLTAQYEKTNYTITYAGLEEGSTHENVATYTISDTVTLTAASDTATKKFVEWQIDDVATTGWGPNATGDKTVTAVYTNIYTITYDLNCGTETTVSTDNVETYTALDTVTLNPAQGTRKTYTFNKWVLVDGEGTEGATVTGWAPGEQTGNLTIKAKWTTGAASVTVGESTIAYATLAEAVEATLAAGEQAVTLKLLRDQSVDSRIEFRTVATDNTTRNITIDLNSKTLSKNATMTGILLFNKNTTATITGGTINCSASAGAYFYANSGATVNVTDGTFTGGASMKSGNGTVAISGGTWNIDPTDYVNTEIFQVVEKDSAYTVYEAAAQVTVGEKTTGYRFMKSVTTAQSALGNVVDGSTLTLLKKADASFEFGTEMTFTLDKNGFTYDLNTKFEAADGYELTKELVPGETDVYTVAITAAGPEIELGGSVSATLGFNYIVTFTSAPSKAPTMKYTDPATGTVKDVTGASVEESTVKYSFAINNIYINHVASDIPVQFYADGVMVAEDNRSVLDYYNTLYGQTDTTNAQKTLIASTIKYGYELQKYADGKMDVPGTPFDYDTKYDATRITDSAPEPATDKEKIKKAGTDTDTGNFLKGLITGVSLDVSNLIAINVRFGDEDGGMTIPSGTKIGPNYLTSDGSWGTMAGYNATKLDKDYNLYNYRINQIHPSNYDQTYKINIMKTTKPSGMAYVTVSVNAYCYKMATIDSTNAALYQAIYGFGVAFENSIK